MDSQNNQNSRHAACLNMLGKVSDSVSKIEETYEGTKEFRAENIRDVFKNKKCNYTVMYDGGRGYSQNDSTVSAGMRIDLSQEDWFAFEDNFGTSEENALNSSSRVEHDKLSINLSVSSS